MAAEATSEATTADQRPRPLADASLPTNSTLVSYATCVAELRYLFWEPCRDLRAGSDDETFSGDGLAGRYALCDFAISLEALGIGEGVVQDDASCDSFVLVDERVFQAIPRRLGGKGG